MDRVGSMKGTLMGSMMDGWMVRAVDCVEMAQGRRGMIMGGWSRRVGGARRRC